jgi:hypothetical protein
MGLMSMSENGGSTRVGSRSLAPRATIFDWRWGKPMVLARFNAGIGGGAISDDGPFEGSPPRDFGRRIVDARRSLLGSGLVKPEVASMGAV